MLFRYDANIVCDASGDVTVYLGLKINGRVRAIQYVAGTLDVGTDLVITGETTGVPILTDSPAASEWYYPAVLLNKNTDGSAATDAFRDIVVLSERIMVVVAQGGNLGAGSISIFVDES